MTERKTSYQRRRSTAAPVRHQASKTNGRAVTTRSAASAAKSSKTKTTGKKKPAKRPARASQPGWLQRLLARRLTLDQRLDLLGILLLAIAAFTLLSLLSPTQGSLTRPWISLWSQALGWGMIAAPVGMAAVGLWLVLRHFGNRQPNVAPARLVGLGLGYLAFIVTAHFAATALIGQESQTIAAAGQGGGYLGSLLYAILTQAVGQVGTALVLLVWWLVAFILVAGITLSELVGQAPSSAQPASPELALQPGSGSASDASRVPTVRTKPIPLPVQPSSANGATANPATANGKNEPATMPAASTQPLLVEATPPAAEAPPEDLQDLPKIEDILDPGTEGGVSDAEIRRRSQIIQNTLGSFGVPVQIIEINSGPSVTQFGVKPELINKRRKKTRAQLLEEAEEVLDEEIAEKAVPVPADEAERTERIEDIARNLDAYEVIQTKVKVAKIASLADDLALALAAPTLRIEAPVPGKSYVGIEVPNGETNIVALRDVIESPSFQRLRSPLRIALGQNVAGQAVAADLARMPHLLIAGTTGSGKSICVNAIICCLMLQNTPERLKMIMIDPKRVELTGYNGVPHLPGPVVVDMERVVSTLQGVTKEMDSRYKLFARIGARNLEEYNLRAPGTGEPKLPYLVVIIDELADLMMQAPEETERALCRLAQMARATGIHMVIATQRPSVDVVTGLIKANFPARIAFAVASSIDSRVILDSVGAERLLGRGDMLFLSPENGIPFRLQGCYVSDDEIHRLTRYWKDKRYAQLNQISARVQEMNGPMFQAPLWEDLSPTPAADQAGEEDELLAEAERIVREANKASVSMLQRRLRIGYTRSARLIDLLEQRGVVGPAQSGSQPREVLPSEPGEVAKEPDQSEPAVEPGDAQTI